MKNSFLNKLRNKEITEYVPVAIKLKPKNANKINFSKIKLVMKRVMNLVITEMKLKMKMKLKLKMTPKMKMKMKIKKILIF